MFLFALAFRMNLPKMFYEYISIRYTPTRRSHELLNVFLRI